VEVERDGMEVTMEIKLAHELLYAGVDVGLVLVGLKPVTAANLMSSRFDTSMSRQRPAPCDMETHNA
jgi:hypothetical protein